MPEIEGAIKLLEMPEIEGAQTLTFIVDDIMQEWVHQTDIFLVDSTCEYNFNDYILELINYTVNTKRNNMELLQASLICWVRDCP